MQAMMAPSHQLLGVSGAVVYVAARNLGPEFAAAVIAPAFVASPLPDLDMKMRVGKWHVRHRGPVTHSLFTGLLYSAVLITIGASIDPLYGTLSATGVAIGWLLHPILDNPTKSGTWWLWPFVRREIHWLPKRFAFYTGTPDRVCSRCGKSKCRCLFARRQCKRCHKSVRACWCGKPEHVFRFVLLAGLLGFVWVTYGR